MTEKYDYVQTPEWVKDAIFYQIFPDRFAQSSRIEKPTFLEPWTSAASATGFKGGDLLGIAEKLDYLQDLGINALYLNPIFQSTANHRYHTCDYFQVDPILGGNKAFQELLDKAHRKGIAIVLDGVFNHTGRGFFQFQHVVENGRKSPFRDWFQINKYPILPYHKQGKHGYEAWWDIPALPKLNNHNPAVRRFLLKVARYWIEFGIDGWRLDVPEEIPDPAFWHTFRQTVKELNPEAYLVGEIWHTAEQWLQGDRFDAVTNYQFARACLAFFIGPKLDFEQVSQCAYKHIQPLNESAFLDEVERLLGLYPGPISESLLNLLGSHDTPRFRTFAQGDKSAYRLATLFQMTYPGVPCIYYGDELGLEGKRDPGCRKAFPWESDKWDSDLRAYVRDCIHLRRNNIVLRRGNFKRLYAAHNKIAYGREYRAEQMIIALNTSSESQTFDLPLANFAQNGTLFQSVLNEGSTSGNSFVIQENCIKQIVLPGRTGFVLQKTV